MVNWGLQGPPRMWGSRHNGPADALEISYSPNMLILTTFKRHPGTSKCILRGWSCLTFQASLPNVMDFLTFRELQPFTSKLLLQGGNKLLFDFFPLWKQGQLCYCTCKTCARTPASTICLPLILSNQMSEGCRHACSRGWQRVAQASVESLFHSKGSSTPLQFRKIKTAFTKQTAAVEAAARDAGNRLSSANLGADFVGMPDAVCVPEACKHSLSVWL